MARGGTGDLLTGIIGGLLAQAPGCALEMTLLGAWLHAAAGELAATIHGRACHAPDIADALAPIWRRLSGEDPDPAQWP